MTEFLIVAVSFCMIMAFSLGYGFLGGKPGRFGPLLLVFTLFSQVALTEIKLGPVSLRIYLVVCLCFFFIVMSGRGMKNFQRRFKKSTTFLVLLGIFYLWMFTCDFSEFRFQKTGMLGYAKDFSSDFVVPVLFFAAMLAIINDKRDLTFVATGFLAVIAGSMFLGFAQYFNFPFSQTIVETLHPAEIQKELASGRYGRRSVRGLSAYSIPFSYTVLTFAPMAFSYAVMGAKKHSWRVTAGVGVFFLCVIVMYLARSRSGFLAMGLSFLMTIFIAPRIFKGINVKNFARLGFALFIVGLLLYLGKAYFEGRETKYEDFSRMANLQDDERVSFTLLALKEINRHPVFGMGLSEFMRNYGAPPHNTFLNAGVSYGYFGVLICIAFHIYFINLCVRKLKRLKLRSISWVQFGCLTGMIAYMWNGLTHNASVITGGFYMFAIYGLFIVSEAIYQQLAEREKLDDSRTLGGLVYSQMSRQR